MIGLSPGSNVWLHFYEMQKFVTLYTFIRCINESYQKSINSVIKRLLIVLIFLFFELFGQPGFVSLCFPNRVQNFFFSNGDPVIGGGQGCQVQGRNPLWNLNPHAFYNPPAKGAVIEAGLMRIYGENHLHISEIARCLFLILLQVPIIGVTHVGM